MGCEGRRRDPPERYARIRRESMKKFYSNDLDAIMDALEESGAFDEEEGSEDTIEEVEDK